MCRISLTFPSHHPRQGIYTRLATGKKLGRPRPCVGRPTGLGRPTQTWADPIFPRLLRLSYSRSSDRSLGIRESALVFRFTRRGLLAAALALRLRFPRPTIQTQLNTLRRFGLPAPPGGALGPRRLGAVYIHQSRCPLPTASASRRVAVAAARWAALFDSPPRLLRPHRALRLAAFTCDT